MAGAVGRDAVLAQLAFEAAWDLMTRARPGARVTADSYREEFGEAVFARPDVGPLILAAERWAAGRAASAGDAALLDRLGVRRPARPPGSYPYLRPTKVPGDLGRLAHFRVVREVGRGGMGVVFEAVGRDDLTAGKRALKVLPPDAAGGNARTRLLREARSQKRVAHPNVVRVYSAASADGAAYIEMDYVFGPTLLDLIDYFRGAGVPAPFPLAVGLAAQVAAGLAAAHGLDGPVAHRDVKPNNVLLGWEVADPRPPGWRAMLCDFGLARAADLPAVTTAGKVYGTVAYLAPERCEGLPGAADRDPAADRPADVFALGTVFYELVTGRHPFLADTDHETIGRILQAAPAPVGKANPAAPVPQWVEGLIARMLAKDPGDRPSAADVVEELGDVTRPSDSTRKPTPGRPRRWRAFVALSVAAVACTTVALELGKDKTRARGQDAGGDLTGDDRGQTITGKPGGKSRGAAEPAGPDEWPVKVVKPAILYAYFDRDDKPEPPRADLAAGTRVTLIGDIDDLDESPRCLVRLSDGTRVWVPSSCLDKD